MVREHRKVAHPITFNATNRIPPVEMFAATNDRCSATAGHDPLRTFAMLQKSREHHLQHGHRSVMKMLLSTMSLKSSEERHEAI